MYYCASWNFSSHLAGTSLFCFFFGVPSASSLALSSSSMMILSSRILKLTKPLDFASANINALFWWLASLNFLLSWLIRLGFTGYSFSQYFTFPALDDVAERKLEVKVGNTSATNGASWCSSPPLHTYSKDESLLSNLSLCICELCRSLLSLDSSCFLMVLCILLAAKSFATFSATFCWRYSAANFFTTTPSAAIVVLLCFGCNVGRVRNAAPPGGLWSAVVSIFLSIFKSQFVLVACGRSEKSYPE
mgnify:CR=1 FL=1